MKTAIITPSLCLEHDPGPAHVESPLRLEAMLSMLHPLPAGAFLQKTARPASLDEVARVHAPEYLSRVISLRGRSAALDHETILSASSVDAALVAAGAGIELVDQLLQGTATNGLALIRPPGHHATQSAGMGYCLLNNIAIAAAYAHRQGIARILILDWDAHHGNGTYDIFSTRNDVLLIDIHQDGLYPETGSVDDMGSGPGYGFTLNVPLPPESDDTDYAYVFEHVIKPAARLYQPELVLVSCGFDAHAGDPTAGMGLSAAGFGRLTMLAREIAMDCAQGRLGLILEGGYALPVLGACVRACVEALTGTLSLPALCYSAIRDRHVVERLSSRLPSLPLQQTSSKEQRS